jgi:acyl-CoA dehydrogenase
MDQEEMTLFRDMTRRALEQEVAPHFEQWEADHGVPRELWNTLGTAGLLCPDMPEQYGAAGTDPQVNFAILEEMSKMGFGGVATGYSIHSNIVAPYINHFGTEEQKDHWLPKMVSGEVLGALAMTEPGAGSDVQGIRTNAVKDGDEWVLNGSKIFITNGMLADLVIVAAITDPGKGAKGTSLFLVDTSLPGFERGKKIEKIGQHTSDTALLFFQDMRLPENALLGEVNNAGAESLWPDRGQFPEHPFQTCRGEDRDRHQPGLLREVRRPVRHRRPQRGRRGHAQVRQHRNAVQDHR